MQFLNVSRISNGPATHIGTNGANFPYNGKDLFTKLAVWNGDRTASRLPTLTHMDCIPPRTFSRMQYVDQYDVAAMPAPSRLVRPDQLEKCRDRVDLP